MTATVARIVRDPRAQLGLTVTDLLDADFSTALVWAEISGRFFADAVRRLPDRVVIVDIREQLLVNVGAGFALTGMRPIVHTFGSFLVARGFEQIKLGFGHQGVGGVLVGGGGSFAASRARRTAGGLRRPRLGGPSRGGPSGRAGRPCRPAPTGRTVCCRSAPAGWS